MRESFEAVYDGSVLRPTRPLSLATNAHVRVTIESELAMESPATERMKQLQAEDALWRAMSPEQRALHAGEWVAIAGGNVVDHDANEITLYRRVLERFGNAAV